MSGNRNRTIAEVRIDIAEEVGHSAMSERLKELLDELVYVAKCEENEEMRRTEVGRIMGCIL